MNDKVKKEVERLIKYYNLNCSIEEFKDKFNKWGLLSRYYTLSEDFIREFKDKINWGIISIFQNLSESFMREFQNKINWHYISIFRKSSKNFIKEFKDELELEQMLKRGIITKEFYNHLKNKKIVKRYEILDI